MKSRCPAPELLVEPALTVGARPSDALGRHLRECKSCQSELMRLRETATLLQGMPASYPASTAGCLDEDDIAAMIEGVTTDDVSDNVVHLASCARCRARLAAVDRLLNEDAVAAELQKLDASVPDATRQRRLPALLRVAAAAAAISAIAVLRPGNTGTTISSESGEPQHRESAITITTAPRIVGPSRSAITNDSLIWTSVPHADRYHVKVFDREGTLVIDQHTTDTTFVMTSQLARAVATTYLWKVEARTGWDRWVASEWGEFTIRPVSRNR